MVGPGGEGHVETSWLAETLHRHADARYKLVVGHHPIFPVNGYGAPCQHVVSPDHADTFWKILVANGVLAYVCSHILAFDVQVHEDVLQITSAGAGTRYRMPEGVEYLHCLQAALDEQGLRCQVFDSNGCVRERLSWPVELPPRDAWHSVEDGQSVAPQGRAIALRFCGRAASCGAAGWQTLTSAAIDNGLAPLWVGLRGPRQRLTVIVGPDQGRSPHYWEGPELAYGELFDIQLMLHMDMGPGGVLHRNASGGSWSSMRSSSAWGVERLIWPQVWHVGHGHRGLTDRRFRGHGLVATIVSV
jgi:hypothetical protein